MAKFFCSSGSVWCRAASMATLSARTMPRLIKLRGTRSRRCRRWGAAALAGLFTGLQANCQRLQLYQGLPAQMRRAR